VSFINSNTGIMKDLTGFLTRKQMERLLKYCENDNQRVLLWVLMRTGRRITEIIGRKPYVHRNKNEGISKVYPGIVGIRPCDILWDSSQISFAIVKKRKPVRKLKYVDEMTLKILKQYIEVNEIQKKEQLFNCTRGGVYKMLRRIGDKAGIRSVGSKRLHPHHFRHSYAVLRVKMDKSAESLRKLQQHLEHHSLDMTAHYLQFNPEDEKEVAEKMWK